MPKFVELWVYLSATPLFGLTATLVVYVVAQAAYARLHQAPWANPVLWTVVLLAGGMLLSGVPYPTYFAGAQFIHFLLGPAVVALAWPLWQRRTELRQRWRRLLLAALVGGTAAVVLRCSWRGLLAYRWRSCCRWHPNQSLHPLPWELLKK